MPLTPMMQQYISTKEEYRDCILFYRLGDFYEMFFEDAKTCARELELTLTGKSCGLVERAPMCGVPYHAVDGYLNRLIQKGYKVAICEQMEDPKGAKGIVKRSVTRIVTPGTNLDTQSLDASKNNFLMCVVYTTNSYGVSYVDVTTGDYYLAEFKSKDRLLDEIGKVSPSEIICNDSFLVSGLDFKQLEDRLDVVVFAVENRYFDEESCRRILLDHFHLASLNGLGLDGYSIGIIAAGAVLAYLSDTQKISLDHINTLHPCKAGQNMLLDRATVRNLELCQTMREKKKKGSLLWVLDQTKTAMGARFLRNAIEQPLLDVAAINERLDVLSALNADAVSREELREYLGSVYDLERLTSKISYRSANARDLVSLKNSLAMLPPIKDILLSFSDTLLAGYGEKMDDLKESFSLLNLAIDEEAPLTVHEGGMIKPGYNEQVDTLRRAKTDGKEWLTKLLEEEKERTGIKNLRIKYNRVFGYYLEVTNSYKDLVPPEWVRKQTLANAERYTTPKLKEWEDTILGAEDRLYNLEYELFCEVREKIYDKIPAILQTAKIVAEVDFFASLAYVAQKNQYVRPKVTKDGRVDIKGGRHPVIEKMIDYGLFVKNDTYLDGDDYKIAVITGPNMAGKSTYMRQTALLVLMAQIGSFVPADSADIGVVDRIFTRVGASDDLGSGQSTFMVEMTEVANILRNATKDSLIILDEIGRGTSTYDGLSIAQAVAEHIADPKILGAKTLFATHYHELTALEGKVAGVHNYCIAVKEEGDDILFLRKIMRGSADKSYGIEVARLAGVPDPVLLRAKKIVEVLGQSDGKKRDVFDGRKEESTELRDGQTEKEAYQGKGQTLANKENEFLQYSLFDDTDTAVDIVGQLRAVDLLRTTPIEALNILSKLQEKAEKKSTRGLD